MPRQKPARRTNSANGGKIRATSEENQLFDKHVGNRVRLRRMILGLSQTTLGDAIGVTFQQVQNMKAEPTELAQAGCRILLQC